MPAILADPGDVAAAAGVTSGSGCSEHPEVPPPPNAHEVEDHAEGATPSFVISAVIAAETLEDGSTTTGPALPLTKIDSLVIEAKTELVASSDADKYVAGSRRFTCVPPMLVIAKCSKC